MYSSDHNVMFLGFKHHNHAEMTELLVRVSQKCPNIMKLNSIGKSVEGRDLWVIEISDNVGVHEEGTLCHVNCTSFFAL